jgi:class 3 adenylate cyclase
MEGSAARATGARTLTASVLFVDVVGSTELRARLGEERADALTRELEAQIGGVVTEQQGRVVKGLGDGVLAVFDSAVDAVAAAVALQQHAELSGRQDADTAVRLRVGLSAGDVSFDGGDVLGTPVVEASRLCAAAQPGQILVADLVRSLSRGRGSFVFESVGDLVLKGLPEPVAACQVVWEPLGGPADHEVHGVPFPGLLASGVASSYVGRDSMTGSLSAMLEQVLGGQSGFAAALLSGEPGIGKTRTAGELARRAHNAGAVVLYGSCDEELGVPFQPFVEALEFYSAHHPAPLLGRLPGELARLCPELAMRVADLPAPAASDPRTEEYRLFEAVTSWLLQASRESGMVLVVDDLHWATRATLLLLAHLLRAASASDEARLVVVGTYRDTELDRRHPLTAVLADLRRVPGVQRVDLQGLNLDETIDLVTSVAGHELDPDGLRLAEAAFAETEGNPLFMGEVLRHFVETATVQLVDGRWQVNDPGQIEVPEGVRDVLGRRLGRLSETANRVLSVASVIGRDFDLELLAQVSDADDNALLDALDEACRARIVEETGQDRFRFFHAMVKETLYGELTSARRRRLHQTVLAALEKLRPHDAVALAYHAVEAGPMDGDLSAAVTHLLEAAGQSLAARDLASAESYFQQAIDQIDAGRPDPVRRVEAACGLGEAQRDQSNPAFRETLLDATRAALALDRPDLAAKAAIANFRGVSSVINDVDRERVEALELTLAAHEGQRTAEVALLGATLSGEIHYDVDIPFERRMQFADDAIEIARELADPRVLAEVILRAARTTLVPQRVEAMMPLIIEVVALADEVGDPTLAALARIFENVTCLVRGDIARGKQTIEMAVEMSQRDCPPLIHALAWANQVQYLIYDGDLDAAAASADQMLTFSLQIGVADAEQWWGAIAMAIAYLRGTYGDLADAAGEFAGRYDTAVSWHGSHAWTLIEAGRPDEAREIVERYALDRPERFPVDDFAISTLGYVAFVAMLLERSAMGAAIETELRPYEDLWMSIEVYCFGPVTWPLAAAVSAQRRFEEADELFARTDRLLEERGLRLARNMMRRDWVLTLSRSDSPAHLAQARTLAELGAATAAQDGHDRLTQTFQELRASLG